MKLLSPFGTADHLATKENPMPTAAAVAGKLLLTPSDHTLILIDFQSQMAFAAQSMDTIQLRNNAGLVAQSAKEFDVPTIVTSVAAKSFSGPFFDEVLSAFPGAEVIDRTSMNTWEDPRIASQVNAIGKSRLVMAGLWTSVCIVGPTLSALDQGFEVYVIADACADVSTEAHERALQRMIQAGVRPMTSLQYLLELQRDWARTESYGKTVGVAKTYGGGYGIGLSYAQAMFGGHEGH
jgi:nicotinamidase-related amidase